MCNATCVWYVANILDLLFFGGWAIWGFSSLGGGANLYSIIFVIMTVLLWIVFILCIINLLTHCGVIKTSLSSRVELYVKIRIWAVIWIVVTGIVIFIIALVYFGVFGLLIGLPVLIVFLIDAVILQGYHKCFMDSCAAIAGGSPTLGGVSPANDPSSIKPLRM